MLFLYQIVLIPSYEQELLMPTSVTCTLFALPRIYSEQVCGGEISWDQEKIMVTVSTAIDARFFFSLYYEKVLHYFYMFIFELLSSSFLTIAMLLSPIILVVQHNPEENKEGAYRVIVAMAVSCFPTAVLLAISMFTTFDIIDLFGTYGMLELLLCFFLIGCFFTPLRSVN